MHKRPIDPEVSFSLELNDVVLLQISNVPIGQCFSAELGMVVETFINFVVLLNDILVYQIVKIN